MHNIKGFSIKVGSLFLWLYSSVTLFVFLYMIYNSLRTRGDLLSNTFGWPESLGFENYLKLFTEENFHLYFFNSALILTVSLFLITFLSSMVAYGLGRYKFKFKKHVQLYFLIGLMFPVQLGIVPIFLLMRDLQLIDTYWSVILLLSAGISLPVLLLTEFFARLPKDIYESAVIDGASEWTTFYKIMFPLARPVVFSICIIMSMQIWNQFFVPLIFLHAEEKKTLPLMIVKYTNNLMHSMDYALVASVLTTVPILILFAIFSRKILEGVASGGVKG